MTVRGPLGWRGALALYADRRMLCILLLGFSSGLPLLLTLSTLSAWLKTLGVDKTTIGLFALVGLPYALKFLWAPIMDGVRIPWLTRRLGRRRSWMVGTQLALAGAILALGASDPGADPYGTALAAFFVAVCSASQDIVIDAYRVEILAAHEQGAGAAATQLGYRVGLLAAGAGALFVADLFGWAAAFAAVAGLMAVGFATALLNPEPAAAETAAARPGLAAWLALHVVEPFGEFARRPRWPAILAFVVLYKFGDALAGVMANPFYIEMGFSLGEIAAVSKIYGLAATLAGIVLGGILTARHGVFASLLLCGVLQAASNLVYAAQAVAGHDIVMLMVTITAENLAGGMGSAAFVAYLSGLCAVRYTATQYALLSALASVGRTGLSASGGWLADHTDWVSFFVITTVAALPGLAVLLWLGDKGRPRTG